MRLSIASSQAADVASVPKEWRAILAQFPQDVRDAWEERAAIIEYDGREPRPTAERRAFECIVGEFEEAAIILGERRAGATAPARRRA